jgi:hypothetical protein
MANAKDIGDAIVELDHVDKGRVCESHCDDQPGQLNPAEGDRGGAKCCVNGWYPKPTKPSNESALDEGERP